MDENIVTIDDSSDGSDYNYNVFGFELQQLSDSLNDFWLKNQLFIEKCQQIKTKVYRFKKTVDIVKTAGTGVSAIGGVAMVSGVVLTPFTGGLSAILWIGGGVATAVGSITSIGTEATNSLKSKKFCTELKLLAEQRDISAQNLNKMLAKFDHFLSDYLTEEEFNRRLNDNRFYDNNKFNEIVALSAKGLKNVYDLSNNSVKMLKSIKEFKSLNVAKSLSGVKSSGNLAQSVTKTAVSLVPTEVKGLNSALVRTTGVSAGKLAFRGVSATAGLVFTAIDVVNLVKDWNKTHPTIDVINQLIDDLEKDILIIQKIYAFITGAYNTDPIDEDLIEAILNSVETNTDSDSDITITKEIRMNSRENTVFYNKTNI